jgi:spermidine/putrescine transport system ATP-binding protein
MPENIIELIGVSKSFGSQAALRGIDLQVKRGEFLTLLGPSGCGKTTLLRLIAGFDTLTSGEIHIGGMDVASVPAEKRPVNTVFQSYALFPHMTVFENVAFGPRLKRWNRKEVEERVLEALQMVSLEAYAERKPHQLSGGQQQRVAIARAIVNKPLVLLLDEPLNALDAKLRKAMQIELMQFQRRLGITFIFVTHDQEEALSMSNRVAVMNEGRIEQIGSPRDIYENPHNQFVARFVGEINVLLGRVLSRTGQILDVELEGRVLQLSDDREGRFHIGQLIQIMVRPEDLRVWRTDEVEGPSKHYEATVEEVIYKGTTVDLILRFPSGQKLSASQFFNEDHDRLEFAMMEKVFVDWIPGWEVLLPHED